jgi:hypothetical protein
MKFRIINCPNAAYLFGFQNPWIDAYTSNGKRHSIGMGSKMKIKFQTTILVNLDMVLQNCEVNVSQEELISNVRGIVEFWAEQRLKDDDWTIPNSPIAIREFLLENEIISEKEVQTFEWV